MVNNLIFRIGAIGIRLIGNPGLEYSEIEAFSGFLSNETPHTSFVVRANPIPIEPPNPPIFETERSWRLYQDCGNWVIWVHSRNLNPYLAGSFTSDYHSGEIFTSENEQEPGKFTFPLSYPLGELLMINLLGTGYGIMLHSSGVIDAEDGIVFAGIGSAGKTTTSRLWNGLPGVRVLNDDRTILRKIDGQFRVYGTPWHGQGGMALAADAPLKKIFILKHARSNQAIRLSPPQAVAELLVRTFAPLWSAPAMTFTLQFLDELCQSVPCYEFGFVPDQSAVEYVRCLSLA
jgi:hypothetical protein